MQRLDDDVGTLRHDNPAAYWLVRALCPSVGLHRFCLLYAYFRWADDIIDAPGREPLIVADFVERQDALIAGAAAPADGPEEALAALISEEEARPIVAGMWAALRFDAQRGPEPIADDDLAEQIARIGDAYTRALWWCAGERRELPPDALWLGRAATAAHMVRDVEIDLALGYCNIPASAGLLDGEAIARWRRERSVEIEAWFERGRVSLPVQGRGPLLLRAFAARYRRITRPYRGRASLPPR